MLASTVIDAFRQELIDDTAPYRWADSVVLGYLFHAQEFIEQHDRTRFLADDGTMRAPAQLTATSQSVPLDANSQSALMLHMCYQALASIGGERADTERAAGYLQRARMALGLTA